MNPCFVAETLSSFLSTSNSISLETVDASFIILRKSVEKYLPNSVLRQAKHGFSIPLSLWMRGSLKNLVNDLLNPSVLKKSGILNPLFYEKYVKPMFLGENNNISIIWSVLMFQLWLNIKKN